VKATLDAAGYTTAVQSSSTSSGTSYNLVADWPGGDRGPRGGAAVGGERQHLAQPSALRVVGRRGAGPARLQHVHVAAADDRQGPHRPRHERRHGGLAHPGYFVYDDNAVGHFARDAMTAYYTPQGVPWEYIDVQGRSDHASFRSHGIATTGIYSGGETIKTSAQASQ
jgi:aminopeptidase S